MAQQSREDADVAGLEDLRLITDRGTRVRQAEPDGVPASGLEPGDEEVVEIDEDADRGAVNDDRRGRDGSPEEGNWWKQTG